METSTAPQTPEEEAALRTLAARHRRRRWWLAWLPSVAVSVHTTLALFVCWHGWPLGAWDLGVLAYLAVQGLWSLGVVVWTLRDQCTGEALERQWALEDVRWRAQTRTWDQAWEERRQRLGDSAGEAFTSQGRPL
jgi:hypothetical protein